MCPCGANSKCPSGRCNRCENRVTRDTSRRAAGLCPKCGLRHPTKGRKECALCRKRFRKQRKRRFLKRKAAGTCTWCGVDEAKVLRALQTFCEKCWIKNRAVAHGVIPSVAWTLWLEQKSICAYTGERMILGGTLPMSASLDHKTPTLRGGGNEKQNLHWVTRKVNLMKSNLTHQEFVALCSRVHFQYATGLC